MSCFDILKLTCPKCKSDFELQTKKGENTLDTYTLENCSEEMLLEVSPYLNLNPCPHCNTILCLDFFERKLSPYINNKDFKLFELEDRIKYLENILDLYQMYGRLGRVNSNEV